jgi:hypothetical protein
MNLIVLIIIIFSYVCAYEPKEYKFSENTPVTILDEENFDKITRIIDIKAKKSGCFSCLIHIV